MNAVLGGSGSDRCGEAARGESVVAATASVAIAWDDHAAALRAYVVRAVRDTSIADDVLQDTFERLLAESAAGRAPAAVRAWLFRVATNLIVSGARRRSVAARRTAELVDRGVVPSPEDLIVEREAAAVLDGRLDGVPEHVRTALLLAAQGFSGAEIARRIGRSELATRSLLCRQRRRLRRVARTAA